MSTREAAPLRKQVVEMRHKMREHLGRKKAGMFGLKQDEGGITDVEFLAQYLVLRHAAEEKALIRWSDNVRLFETMADYDILAPEQAMQLKQAYCVMRDEIHRLSLLGLPAYVEEGRFSVERQAVQQIWQALLEPDA